MAQLVGPRSTESPNQEGQVSLDSGAERPASRLDRTPFAPIEMALAAFARGELVAVVDDEGRENEGDLIMAAEYATAARVAFMVRYTSGVLCVAMPAERLDELELPLMVPSPADTMGTAFAVSVDAIGVGTGISAADRAHTIRTLADPTTTPGDLLRPGHVFPLRARAGGVLTRPGHTEAGVDLARLTGTQPAAVLAEIVTDDGRMARLPDLERFVQEHDLVMISIADLLEFRRRREQQVRRVASLPMPTAHGNFVAHVYESCIDGTQHIALVRGTIESDHPVLVRVHSECLTGDVFGSRRCDCGQQLDLALAKVVEDGSGVVLYLRGHEGRGIGLGHKLRAYALQELGLDTVEANLALGFPVDLREYGTGAHILADLGIRKMRLMTNNPSKCAELEGHGLEIVERLPLAVSPCAQNLHYLRTKQERLGHLLNLSPDVTTSTAVRAAGERL